MTGTIDINATSVDHDAPLREPRDADWTGQSLGAIVGRIADRSGLTPAVAPELRAARPDGAVQSGESDRAFLRRLAAAVGGEVAVKDGHVIVLAAGQALSAGSALPLDTIEIDLDGGDWWTSGLVTLATIGGEAVQVTLTGPLRPDIRPFHPLRILGSRLPILRDRGMRVDDVYHSVSAFSAPSTVFRAVSTPARPR